MVDGSAFFLDLVELNRELGITGIDDEPTQIADFALRQNYPNPFNPSTTIEYSLGTASEVKITVYNLAGQIVRTLVNGSQSAGAQSVEWDGRDDTGLQVSSGIYLYRLEAGDFVQTRKMVLLK